MNRASASSLLAFLICGCASGVDSLIESERAFAALSLARDTRTAFLSFLDDSAVIFRPHPVNGREWIGQRPARPSILAWEPTFADCSADGDMGFTTGPWKLSTPSSPGEPVAFGWFVSVWGRRPGAVWKVLLDVGISTPKPASDIEPLRTGPLSRHPGKEKEPPPSPGLLLEAERRFGQELEHPGTPEAYRTAAAAECRFYREGQFPAIGYEQGRALIDGSAQSPVFSLLAFHESTSADLAYAYGRYEFHGEGKPSGYYVHIWEITRDGPRLVLDLLSPLPRE